jgi:hypothetical protein
VTAAYVLVERFVSIRRVCPSGWPRPARNVQGHVLAKRSLDASQPALAQAPAAQPVYVRGTIVSSSARSILVNTGGNRDDRLRPAHSSGRRCELIARQDNHRRFYRNDRCASGGRFAQGARSPYFPRRIEGKRRRLPPLGQAAESMMANATVHSIEQPHNMMANATVQRVGSGAAGRTVVLAYKGGTKTVTIPPDVPVVTFEPGTISLLANGAYVFVLATRTADGLVARLGRSTSVRTGSFHRCSRLQRTRGEFRAFTRSHVQRGRPAGWLFGNPTDVPGFGRGPRSGWLRGQAFYRKSRSTRDNTWSRWRRWRQ